MSQLGSFGVDPTRFDGKRVGVVFGGTSDEREISLKTGRALLSALKSYGHQVVGYDLPTDFERLRSDKPEAVVLAMHGGFGEDGHLQGWLSLESIPFTGSRLSASAIAMDKERTKLILRGGGVPVAKSWFIPAHLAKKLKTLDKGSWLEEVFVELHLKDEIEFPVILKRNSSGSSYSVSCHQDATSFERQLLRLLEEVDHENASDGILIEAFIEGPEYSVGFYNETFLGAIEIKPASGFYDIEAKYHRNDTEYIPVVDLELLEELEAVGRKSYQLVGCQGVARVDVMGEKGKMKVLEINTLPGMTESSLIPKMAQRLGFDFETFANLILCGAN